MYQYVFHALWGTTNLTYCSRLAWQAVLVRQQPENISQTKCRVMNQYFQTSQCWQPVALAVVFTLIASCNSTAVRATETDAKDAVLAKTTFDIGDTGPGGGVVFALTNDGANGLEFAPEVLSGDHISWGCSQLDFVDIPNLTGFVDSAEQLKPIEDVQSGRLNSNAIAKETGSQGLQRCSAPAAQAAFDYSTPTRVDGDTNVTTFSDWYLPSIEELLLIERYKMDVPLVLNEFEVLTKPSLWSSTEHTKEIVWFLLPDGSASIGNKDLTTVAVLPVRSF